MLSQDFDYKVNSMLAKVVTVIREDLSSNQVNWSLADLETMEALKKLDLVVNEIHQVTERHLKEMAKRGYVYLMLYDTGSYKIGESKDVTSRLYGVRHFKGNRRDIQLIHKIETDDTQRLEYELHEQYNHRHIGGEMFALTQEDVFNICVIASCFYDDKSTKNIRLF